MLRLTLRVGRVLVAVGGIEHGCFSLPDLPLRLKLLNTKLSFPLPPPLLSDLKLDLRPSKKRNRIRGYRLDDGSEEREESVGRRGGGGGGGRRRLELSLVWVCRSFDHAKEGGEIFRQSFEGLRELAIRHGTAANVRGMFREGEGARGVAHEGRSLSSSLERTRRNWANRSEERLCLLNRVLPGKKGLLSCSSLQIQ